VHLLQPRVGEVAAGDAGADHCGDAPRDPGAFLGGGCGVHHRLHLADRLGGSDGEHLFGLPGQ
jgi:hypothetical protein